MHKINTLICLLIIVLIFSGFTEEKNKHLKPERVVISGKVLNFNPDKKEVTLDVQRLGEPREVLYAKLDSLGKFSISFESYIPTEVGLDYLTSFLVLTHPGDSIYVEFDGKQKDEREFLKTIKFSGDAAKTNQYAASYRRMYFSSVNYKDMLQLNNVKKAYDLDRYNLYLDTLQQKNRTLYNKFVSDVSPNEETEIWALTNIEEDYYDALLSYPYDYPRANHLNENDWSVPASYYGPLMKRFPFTKPMLISGFALNNFINRFNNLFVQKNINEELNKKYKKGVSISGSDISKALVYMDSLTVYGRIKYTPDTLLRQMVLTDLFSRKLDEGEIALFEKYRKVVDEYIQEPFLIEPLLEKYLITKKRIEKPSIASEVILKKMDNSSVKQIMDNILLTNKGKVIYLDCWATWCAPCLQEMPKSKYLMKRLEGKEVVFVYLCLDSEENLWKTTMSKYEISGQNYFLTKEQSTDIRKAFAVEGVPYYILFDKNGTIVDKGSHLRPDSVKEKIEAIIQKSYVK